MNKVKDAKQHDKKTVQFSSDEYSYDIEHDDSHAHYEENEEMQNTAYELKVEELRDYDNIIDAFVLGEVINKPRFKNPLKFR